LEKRVQIYKFADNKQASMKKNHSEIRNIIFDFGGVIYDISFEALVQAFNNCNIPQAEELYTQNVQNNIFVELERGLLSEKDFYVALRNMTGSKLSDKVLEDCWNAILLDYKKSRIDTIKALRANYRLYLMSNTNEIHYRHFSKQFRDQFEGELPDLFDKAYLSYEMKRSKPDPEIFKQILNENKLNPEETVFIDDTRKNVDIILPLGIRGIHLNNGTDMCNLFENGKLVEGIEIL
jgi:putative hydrolase of the HAD superfamily